MKKYEELKLMIDCTLGKKSHINIVGKVLFFPIIAWMIAIFFVLELLFTKADQPSTGKD